MLILEGTITTNLVLVFCYVLPFFFAEAYVSPGLVLASVSSDLIFDRLHTCYIHVTRRLNYLEVSLKEELHMSHMLHHYLKNLLLLLYKKIVTSVTCAFLLRIFMNILAKCM